MKVELDINAQTNNDASSEWEAVADQTDELHCRGDKIKQYFESEIVKLMLNTDPKEKILALTRQVCNSRSVKLSGVPNTDMRVETCGESLDKHISGLSTKTRWIDAVTSPNERPTLSPSSQSLPGVTCSVLDSDLTTGHKSSKHEERS